MYGILAVISVIVAAFGYYSISTYTDNPYTLTQIQLTPHFITDHRTIYGTCINKKILTQNLFLQLKLKAKESPAFAIMFDHNPLLQCQQISQAFDLSRMGQKIPQIRVEKIEGIEKVFGEYEIQALDEDSFIKVKKNALFVLILAAVQQNTNIQPQSRTQNPSRITLATQNENYSRPLLKPLFWFSWFSLIGISLVSYYRKNVFNTKAKLLSSIALLVYLIWIGFDYGTLMWETEEKVQLAMHLFVLIVCLKSRLGLWKTLSILGFSVFNQVGLQMGLRDQILLLGFAANILNAKEIAYGQNIEVVCFSVFSFIVQYGLINKFVDIMSPMVFSLIVANLVLGPVIYELLQLKQDFNVQLRKTKERLQSYEVSESDNLFRH